MKKINELIPEKALKLFQSGRGRVYIAGACSVSNWTAGHWQWLYKTGLSELDTKDPVEILKVKAKDIIKKEISKKAGARIGHLSRITKLSKEMVIQVIDEIEKETGLPVEIEDGTIIINKFMKKNFEPTDIGSHYKNFLKIGVVSDTHFGSKYQQMSLLHETYNIFEKENVNFAIHAGDLVDGSPKMHVGFLHELFIYRFDEQVQYVIEHYPKTDKFKTYIRPGNHDYSWIKSDAGDPVKMVCRDQSRNDLVYLSPENASFTDKSGNILIELFHPSGGIPYAKSYRGQKLYESTVSDALAEYHRLRTLSLPNILAIGHLHMFDFFISGYSNIMLVPAFQSVTPYLKSKGLSPMVGALILNIKYSDEGNILKITPDVYNFSAEIKEKDY